MRRLITFLSVLGLLVVFSPAAHAGQGAPIDRFNEPFEAPLEHDEFLSEVCGIDIYVEGSGRDVVSVFEDGSVVANYTSKFILHSPDTGETLYRTDAAKANIAPETEVFDPEAETLTISFSDTYTGLPAMWSKKGEGVLLRDAGWVTFEGTLVLDVSGDEPELISIDESIMQRGPHPELETDVVAFICEALGA